MHRRMLDCLGKAGERCLRRAILGVPVPEASPQQRMMNSLGQLYQPAPQKGKCLIPTHRFAGHVEGGYSISGDAERLHQFVSKREDVADAVSTGLVR